MPNMQLVEKYHEGLGEFSSQTRFEVGNGSKIRLWHDKWCGEQVLKEFFFHICKVFLSQRMLL
jgi:hypothetical protein